MRHPYVRPLSKLASRLLVPALLPLVVACGSSEDKIEEAPPSSNGGTSGTASSTNGMGQPAGVTPEQIAELTEVFEMAADQIQAACGPVFDRCDATPGCNEILTCAATNACSGAACYCVDAACTTDGPCRSVIDGAPGARTPDASNPSLGPAPDAAGAVGVCLQGLGGGGVPTPTPTPTDPAPVGGDSADAGVGAAPDAG